LRLNLKAGLEKAGRGKKAVSAGSVPSGALNLPGRLAQER
jgi:hypothetical protein